MISDFNRIFMNYTNKSIASSYIAVTKIKFYLLITLDKMFLSFPISIAWEAC
jgi:hypothetical protein